MNYLVDTDWAIDYLNGVQQVVERLNGLLPEGVGLSIISLAEIYEGVFRANSPRDGERQVDNFLSFVELVYLDDAVCRIFARERARLRAEGNLIDNMDLLIGSTAMRYNLTLLTNNRRHFERVRDISILSV